MNDDANRKFQKELNSGAISLVLMALIADSGHAMYGYEIARRLPSLPDGELPMNESAIYPVLRSLERQGLLASQMKSSDSGPPRKYYGLTPTGARTLVKWRIAWSQTKDFVDKVLESKNDDDPTTHTRSKLPRTI